MKRTRPLDPIEIRVLGVLMEKQQTTPDYYPMTISAVIAGCNQKSSRDPVTKLTETEVVEALDRLAADVLAWRSAGARAERWEQRLDRRWSLDGGSKAVMTLLMLRGPQTPGELRARSDRMHSFGDVSEVQATLDHLAGGDDPLVRVLARQPGKREARWAHIVGTDDPATDDPDTEIDGTIAGFGTAAPARPVAAGAEASSPSPTRPAPHAVEKLSERIDRLENELASLRDELTALVERLGG